METNVTLQNSTELHLNNDEVFLRSIPAKLKVGTLTTDTLRLLVYYVTKASPYELAVESGNFEGTLQEWLESLQANLSFKAIVDAYADLATVVGLEQGDLAFVTSTGKAYPFSGTGFPTEDKGLEITGDSAYQLAKKAGFVGTEAEWLVTLKGAKGDQGIQGVQGDTGLKGETGDQGDQGPAGTDGADGKSAYTLATELGFVGSEADWILSLKGPQGIKGETGDVGGVGPQGDDGVKGDAFVYSDFTPEQLLALKGPKGDTGADGTDGVDGVTQNATTIVMTGLVTDTATPALDTDTLLIVIGKLQAQITALEARVVALETV